MNFELLRQKRKEKGLTQRQLSNRLGGYVDASTISRWENGLLTPGIPEIQRLSGVLNFTIDEILGVENPEKDELVRQLIFLLPELSLNELRGLILLLKKEKKK